jgi:SAM-dependent methyltransferase
MPVHPCRVCGSSHTSQWKERSLDRDLEPDDLRISDSRYGVTLALWRCPDCGFIFAPAGDVEELTSLYERLTDPGYAESQDSRVLQMRWLLRKTLEHKPDAVDMLEIGAGTGLLVREAVKLGLEAVGVEPSAWLVECGRDSIGVELIQGVYPHSSLAGRRFDLVFVVDVIEHVADPLRLLRDCRSALKPGGILAVVTPDISSMAAKLLPKRWWHFRVAHVCFFDRRSLGRAAANAGLVPQRWIRSKWFFQVRYLAERSTRYLPTARLNRMAERTAPLRWFYDRVIPLNLYDSYLVLLKSSEEQPRGESTR